VTDDTPRARGPVPNDIEHVDLDDDDEIENGATQANGGIDAPTGKPRKRKAKARKARPAKPARQQANGAAGEISAEELTALCERLAAIEGDIEFTTALKQNEKLLKGNIRDIRNHRAAQLRVKAEVSHAADEISAEDLKALYAQLAAIDDEAAFAAALKQHEKLIRGSVRDIRKCRDARLRAEAEARKREIRLSTRPPPGTGRGRGKPDANGVIWPFGFTMQANGLFYQPLPGTDGEAEPVRIAAPFEIVAQTRDDQDHEHGLLLRWTSRTAQPHQWSMPQAMVHADGNAIAAELQGAGLPCGTSRVAHEQLKHFLGAVESIHLARCVDRCGWHGSAFVLPTGRCSGPHQTASCCNPSRFCGVGHSPHKEPWRNGRNTSASLRLAIRGWFFASAKPSPRCSSTLRTTLPAACTSTISRKPERPRQPASARVPGGQVLTWQATANGLEVTAAQHNDLPAYFEEISQADARVIGPTVYLLGNQAGKIRMSRGLRAARQKSWRFLYHSTGEITLAAKLAEAGLRPLAGQEIRLLNVPADAGVKLGVFETLHGVDEAPKFADQLRLAAVTYFGTAGPAFLEKLAQDRAKDEEQLKRVLQDSRDQFLKENLPDGADGQVRSAAMRFALIAAAGELAVAYHVLPWPEGEATKAAAACFRAWLGTRGSAGAAEDRQAVETLRLFIAQDGASRFEYLDRKEQAEERGEEPPDQLVIRRAGFVRAVGGGKQFLIFPMIWREIFKGMDPEQAARVARDTGFLLTLKSGRHLTQPVRIPGLSKRLRFYVISDAILAGEDVCDAIPGGEDESDAILVDEDA
jgi:hypothetical protein